ncbi:MAG: hypothetical protein LBU65_09355 [Planctomycetaceae bacterium]|nr:hypothetical protein [Planctomycetaceae bacterium]
MQNENEDVTNKREAVLVGVTVATYLITASLAMIAVLGHIVVQFVGNRQISCLFGLLFFLSFISFVVSIVFACFGIGKIRRYGYEGNWNLKITNTDFNLQAIFSFIGLCFFVLCIIFITLNPVKKNRDMTDVCERSNIDSSTSSTSHIHINFYGYQCKEVQEGNNKKEPDILPMVDAPSESVDANP